MTREEIEAKLKNRDNLTDDEKAEVAQAIQDNPETREILLTGMLAMGRYSDFFILSNKYAEQEAEKPAKPSPAKYGWEEPTHESQGGWTIEGGEEAYNEALEKWEATNG